MRQLFWLAQGAWNRTASTMAQFARAHFKNGSRAKADQFNPYGRPTRGTKLTKENFGMLGKLLGAKKVKGEMKHGPVRL